MNAVSGCKFNQVWRAYAKSPAAYSPVFTRPPWHSSNPFEVVNLNMTLHGISWNKADARKNKKHALKRIAA